MIYYGVAHKVMCSASHDILVISIYYLRRVFLSLITSIIAKPENYFVVLSIIIYYMGHNI